MKNLLFFFSLFLFNAAMAQTPTAPATTAPVVQTATVVVNKDPRIDLLIKKKAAINRATKKASARSGPGFRLLVMNTNSRDEAIAAKTKVYTHYPELKAYLQYQTPYFKLKAGNFKTREEAGKYRKLMASMFPKGIFIINDVIELKPEKEKEETEEL